MKALTAAELHKYIQEAAYYLYLVRLKYSLALEAHDRLSVKYFLYFKWGRWPDEDEITEWAAIWHHARVHGYDVDDWLLAEFILCARFMVRDEKGNEFFVAKCPDLEDRGTNFLYCH